MTETASVELLQALSNAINAVAIYPAHHPQAAQPISGLAALLADRQHQHGHGTTLLLVGDDLVVDGEAERTASLYRDSLRRALGRLKIERLSFLAGCSPAEVAAITTGLAGRGPLAASPHVVLGRLADGDEGEAADAAGSLDDSHLEALEKALSRLYAHDPHACEALDHALWQLLERLDRPSRRHLLLTELPAAERPHLRHAVAVGLDASRLARALGIGGSMLHSLTLGALVHDFGLWHMPAMLFDELAPAESTAEALHLHPELGAARLAAISGMPEAAVLIAYEHHLHWDGRGGYPTGGGKPGLAAQIVAVADHWDLAFCQPGSPARTARRGEARDLLGRLAGRVLHPRLVETFLALDDASAAADPSA